MKHQTSEFEEILLPPVILAGLYPNSLVVLEKTVTNPKQVKKQMVQSVEEDILIPALISVAAEAAEPAVQHFMIPKKEVIINWLGEFNKQVLVFVEDENSVHLADTELDLLGKMLQAIKLSLADIAVVNTGKQKVTWAEVLKSLPAKQVIFFGVDPLSIEVPFRLPHFRPHHWNDITLLYSPSLAAFNKISPEQNVLKKQLWKALQEMFAA